MATRPIDSHLVTLRQQLPELAEKYHVRSLEVFGSYIRDEQTSESDLDVLVTFDKAPGLLQYIALENHLSDLLGVKVDLVMKSALKPRIGQNILREVRSGMSKRTYLDYLDDIRDGLAKAQAFWETATLEAPRLEAEIRSLLLKET
jgi:uncharacterized protein